MPSSDTDKKEWLPSDHLPKGPQDYPEDYDAHGCYECSCQYCGQSFHAAKDRIWCKQCTTELHDTPGGAYTTIRRMAARYKELEKKHEDLREACMKENGEICDILGRALKYSMFKDDQKNFPGATDADGVCVGEHVGITLVEEAAVKIKKLEAGITQFPGQGHDRPCYYCGEKTNGLAGNPGLWPIPLCHADEPGKVKWHHSSCVTDRLVENQSRLEKVLRLEISNLKIDLQHANESLDAYRKGFDGAMKALE